MCQLQKINHSFSVCKLVDFSQVDWSSEYCFTAKTDEENSLVCITQDIPDNVIEREDGWKAFRIKGILDFSLIGILAKLSTLLANNHIGIFAVSTYHTDYILTKECDYLKALEVLSNAGYEVL
ncbi:MAG: ACT domain-containing protein [Eubacteriales bacterium]|nr:ACT domain-containing protein [Eubacteriales bacterium]